MLPTLQGTAQENKEIQRQALYKLMLALTLPYATHRSGLFHSTSQWTPTATRITSL